MPDFTSPTSFPSFYELPPTSAAAAAAQSPETYSAFTSTQWYLLAQVKENMTITQPTLIATDRAGVDFALVFDDTGKSLKAFKKGHTLVVPRALRTDREEGKKAIVRVEKGKGDDVKVISGRLARVLELGKLLDGELLGKRCGACGVEEGTLSRCLGCGVAVYCSKDCQATSWNELDHKSNCKVIRAVDTIWK